MNNLEQFLNKYDNSEININDIYDHTKFGYSDKNTFNHHLKFLLDNCYTIKIKGEQKIRLNQHIFRKELFKKYNGKCIITNNDCEHELIDAHIIPVCDDESYDINNVLLLTATLHNTMDKLLWAINPDTLIIETKKEPFVACCLSSSRNDECAMECCLIFSPNKYLIKYLCDWTVVTFN